MPSIVAVGRRYLQVTETSAGALSVAELLVRLKVWVINVLAGLLLLVFFCRS